MKTIHYLSALTFLFFSFSLFAQEDKPVKRMAITDVQIYSGMLLKKDVNGTLADFRRLAPQSSSLNSDLSKYFQDERNASSGDMGSSIMIGIQFRDKNKSTYKSNPLLRLGFNYSSGSTISGSMRSESNTPYDTLISSQTGQQIYVDSTLSESYGMYYSSDQLRFDGSLIFRTNPDARWSVYAGLGISAGISISASTRVHYNETRSEYAYGLSYDQTSTHSNTFPNDYRNEIHKNKTNFSFTTYVPLGVDFRVCNKNKFWSRIHLFYELKPAISLTSIPELTTITNMSFQHGLGLRVAWN